MYFFFKSHYIFHCFHLECCHGAKFNQKCLRWRGHMSMYVTSTEGKSKREMERGIGLYGPKPALIQAPPASGRHNITTVLNKCDGLGNMATNLLGSDWFPSIRFGKLQKLSCAGYPSSPWSGAWLLTSTSCIYFQPQQV